MAGLSETENHDGIDSNPLGLVKQWLETIETASGGLSVGVKNDPTSGAVNESFRTPVGDQTLDLQGLFTAF